MPHSDGTSPMRPMKPRWRRVLAERDRGAFARLRGRESAAEELLRDRRLEVAREDCVSPGAAG